MKRWSKLQKELDLLIDPEIDFQIHCVRYRMNSQYGSTDLPRYFITLQDEIIFDYPKNFMGENGEIIDRYGNRRKVYYPYSSDISDISDLIREYIDTPKEEVFEKDFENDVWGFTDILKSADRRTGKRRLALLQSKNDIAEVNKIIDLRLKRRE